MSFQEDMAEEDTLGIGHACANALWYSPDTAHTTRWGDDEK